MPRQSDAIILFLTAWNGQERKQELSAISVLLLFILQKILGAYGDGGAIFTNDDAAG